MATILCVDDEWAPLATITTALEGRGHTILEAKDQDEALQHWKNRGPEIDLVITDYHYPGGDKSGGLGLIRRVLDDRPEMGSRIIIAASVTGDEQKGLAGLLGEQALSYNRCLFKPFGIEQARAVVGQALERPLLPVPTRDSAPNGGSKPGGRDPA